MAQYGMEVIIDLHNCDVSTFTEENVERFCVGLCGVIDMKREAFHLWASDPSEIDSIPPHLYGVSAVQFITTSNLVVHTLPKLGNAYVNLFSCKEFNAARVERFVEEFFRGRVVRRTTLGRL